jgi:hypothetical protein
VRLWRRGLAVSRRSRTSGPPRWAARLQARVGSGSASPPPGRADEPGQRTVCSASLAWRALSLLADTPMLPGWDAAGRGHWAQLRRDPRPLPHRAGRTTKRRLLLPRWSGNGLVTPRGLADSVGPHHLVVFVFDDVAVPHKQGQPASSRCELDASVGLERERLRVPRKVLEGCQQVSYGQGEESPGMRSAWSASPGDRCSKRTVGRSAGHG